MLEAIAIYLNVSYLPECSQMLNINFFGLEMVFWCCDNKGKGR